MSLNSNPFKDEIGSLSLVHDINNTVDSAKIIDFNIFFMYLIINYNLGFELTLDSLEWLSMDTLLHRHRVPRN